MMLSLLHNFDGFKRLLFKSLCKSVYVQYATASPNSLTYVCHVSRTCASFVCISRTKSSDVILFLFHN